MERQEQGKPDAVSNAELRKDTVLVMLNAVKEKWDTILILVVLLGGLVGIINPRFDSLEANLNTKIAAVETNLNARIDAVETNLNARIDAVETNLNARIDAVETKFDNRFTSLAEMMIVAHTNGEATREELLAIWQRVAEDN
ncbi:MAG: hypothetical protein OXG78_15610 [Chloroflexi bacterium]|nr:hypothetical protein [Chloroflexota bacterium]